MEIRLVDRQKIPRKPQVFGEKALTTASAVSNFVLALDYPTPSSARRSMSNDAKKTSAKSITKAELFNQLAETTGMSKADVRKFFEALSGVITKNLGKKGTGVLTLPGLMKLKTVKKAATKGGERRPNPFKPGEFIITKPKPASVKVKAFAVKALNESIK